MLSIRMRRMGAKKNPHFRVVVADSSNSPDGAFIEILGHYHPRFEPARVTLDLDAVKSWIAKGAQPSDTVRTLLKQIETGKLEMTEGTAQRPGAAEPTTTQEEEAAVPAAEAAEEGADGEQEEKVEKKAADEGAAAAKKEEAEEKPTPQAAASPGEADEDEPGGGQARQEGEEDEEEKEEE